MTTEPREIGGPLTYKDLEHTPDDGNRYEVIDGALFVTPFSTYPHQEAATQLLTILNAHVRGKGLGKVFASGLIVVLDTPTGVGPDIVYISSERMRDMREDGYHGVPDLLVEVLSSKPQLDRFVKASKYASAGVAHYWIVDPKGKTLTALRLQGGRYRVVVEAGRDDTFEPELFPGLAIDLSDLWVL